MIAFVILGLMFALPPIAFCFLLDAKLEREKKEKNRQINEARYVKNDYELDAINFVNEEKRRLEELHIKRLSKITKKYNGDFVLGNMTPDDLDEYMREESYHTQKLALLEDGLKEHYKNKWGV